MKRSIIIEIRANRIAFVVGQGNSARCETLHAELGNDEAKWCQDLLALAPQAARILEAMNASGAAARVLYRSPSHASDLSAERTAGRDDALAAARLRCADSLPGDAAMIIESAIVGTDRQGDQRCFHVVVAGDRAEITQAIVQFVQSVGLRFRSATPIDAGVTASLAHRCLGRNCERAAYLYVGSYNAMFLVGGGGTLDFFRRISLGFERLARSLTRPVRTDEGMVQLTPVQARDVLQRHGLPAPDDVIDGERGLTGRQILPQLQPQLQRSVIEIRQSLRFGLSDDAATRIPIRLLGPGAAIPGLAQLLAEELDTEVTIDPDQKSGDWNDPSVAGSELLDAARYAEVLDQINLEPDDIASARRTRRLRRWLVTGAAAALALVAFDAVRYEDRLTELRSQAADLAQSTEDARATQAAAAQLKNALAGSNAIEALIQKSVGSRLDIAACMREIEHLTPEHITFTAVLFEDGTDATGASLSGFVTSADGSRVKLANFVDTLRASPLFRNVQLGGVQLGSLGGQQGSRFEIAMNVIEAPAPGYVLTSVTDTGDAK